MPVRREPRVRFVGELHFVTGPRLAASAQEPADSRRERDRAEHGEHHDRTQLPRNLEDPSDRRKPAAPTTVPIAATTKPSGRRSRSAKSGAESTRPRNIAPSTVGVKSFFSSSTYAFCSDDGLCEPPPRADAL